MKRARIVGVISTIGALLAPATPAAQSAARPADWLRSALSPGGPIVAAAALDQEDEGKARLTETKVRPPTPDGPLDPAAPAVSSPALQAPPPAAATRARNRIGVAGMLPLKYEPVRVPAGGGAVTAGGFAWETSPLGGEAFYARPVYGPTAEVPIEVAVEAPLAYAPRIQWPPDAAAEVFDDETGQSLGPAPEYSALYLTPRLSIRYPTTSRLQFLVSLGWGVAWFSQDGDGGPHAETGFAVQYQLGGWLSMGPRWALRASFGGYGQMTASERRLYALNVGLVRAF